MATKPTTIDATPSIADMSLGVPDITEMSVECFQLGDSPALSGSPEPDNGTTAPRTTCEEQGES